MDQHLRRLPFLLIALLLLVSCGSSGKRGTSSEERFYGTLAHVPVAPKNFYRWQLKTAPATYLTLRHVLKAPATGSEVIVTGTRRPAEPSTVYTTNIALSQESAPTTPTAPDVHTVKDTEQQTYLDWNPT